ncbi:glycosyltransferase family 2 protein [Microbacterium sp. LRZ72]|uniref:glycosyltransferase family 2 protein n=1 Tax=Microbacterium sp. LRZ72 TaxID=2942481 RepID=UPI0029BC7C8B|nr:glycosyltransferase family 2 protein [Microbacterium sp. LRZ72]MDX2377464.1 glycosyltransferase family 2 protein [Microbacterium sp. LRZ72]
MTAALIIVNYGSSGLLEANAAANELPGGCELIVVDCYSGHAERARVAALCERHGWSAVLLEENRGFGGGVNAGAQLALEHGADVLVTLNPDAVIDAQALAALIDQARTQPDALVAPRIVTGSGASWFQGADLYLDDGSVAGAHRRVPGRPRREWLTGACLAVSAALWRRVGGFDEDYFLYWEDIDLSHRVLDAGGRLVIADVRAVHDEGQTHEDARAGRAKSETYYYYNVRNRLMYAGKHLGARDRRAWLRATPRVSYGILLQGGRRQFLRSLAPWRAGVRGMRDGVRLVRAQRMPSREPRPSPRARGART